jgi:hypothetical protein
MSGGVNATLILLVLAAFCVNAQEVVSLEKAASRGGPDFTAVYEGLTITVRAQVAAAPL